MTGDRKVESNDSPETPDRGRWREGGKVGGGEGGLVVGRAGVGVGGTSKILGLPARHQRRQKTQKPKTTALVVVQLDSIRPLL